MDKYHFTVTEKFNNYKAVDFLRSIGVSWEIIQKLKYGNIDLNGQVLPTVVTRVNCGDTLTLNLPKDTPNPYVTPTFGKLNIIYEDEYMLAVNKPVGMQTHASKNLKLPSLDSLVCGYFSPAPFVFRGINRLDRDTSGIVLVAKDMVSACFLGEK